jgi:hypothetical protein
MKKPSFHNYFAPLALAGLLALTGCNKSGQTATEQTAKPAAQPNSFQQVTKQLDPGGELYVYLSTEQWLGALSSKVANYRGMADGIPDLGPSERAVFGKAFDVITNIIKDSGIENVSGFGMSSIARETNCYHTKVVLHHYEGKDSGFLWELCGRKPHALAGQDFLPASTAFATFSDLDVALAWSVLSNEVSKAGLPEADDYLDKIPAGFEHATGLKWDQVVASLGGEFGFVMTLDDSRKIPLPIPGADPPVEIPEPGLMLVAKVKDDTIFNRIDKALASSGQTVVSSNKNGCNMRTVSVPLPLPIQLRPTVATSGGYLFVATTDALIQEALAVKAGQKPGLKSTEEFKRLATDVPSEGNHFSFVSQRFSRSMRDLQKGILPLVAAAKGQGQQMQWLESFFTSTNAPFSYSVSANTSEGWLMVCNGNQHPGKMLLVGAAVPVGIVSAMALPAIAKARAAAQKNAAAAASPRASGE